jgi:hypothetical protein
MGWKNLTRFCSGGPASDVSSFAWQIALNLTFAPAFEGLEQYEILGMCDHACFQMDDETNMTAKRWMYEELFHPTR